MKHQIEQHPSPVWGLFVTPLYALIGRPELFENNTNISCAVDVIAAYTIAFDLEHPVDESLLIAINSSIINGVQGVQTLDTKQCGDFRTCSVNYALPAQDALVNCLTPQGMEQLITTWFAQSSAPTDYIHFKAIKEKTSDCYVQPKFYAKPKSLYDEDNRLTIPILEIRKVDSPSELQLLHEDHEKVYDIASKMSMSTSVRVCYFNPVSELATKFWYADACNITMTNAVINFKPMKQVMSVKQVQELIKPLPEKISIKDILRFKLAEISKEYQQGIGDAKNNEEKLTAIVSAIQKIAQIHPFLYSMEITCEILLNRLLHENKLPMTILMYSKRLFGYSLEEALQEVKNGQQVFLDALSGKDTVTFRDDVKNESHHCHAKMPINGLTKSQSDQMLTTVCLVNVHRAFSSSDLTKRAILSVYSASSIEQALRRAVATGNQAATIVILQNGVDIDAQDNNKKRTALHWAVIKNNTKMIELLMNYGAQVSIQDGEQKTPLDYASSDEVRLLLISEGTVKNTLSI